VYQYAVGISGAYALSQHILSGQDGAVENYLKFLKAGNSMYPLDLLKMAGVDLTKPDAIEDAFRALAQMIDRLEKLICM
jgi:oligoendopeptidase F